MNCPGCGASNPEGSRWCGQCHASFEAAPAPAEPLAHESHSTAAERSPIEQHPPPGVAIATAPSSGFAVPALPSPSVSDSKPSQTGPGTSAGAAPQASGFAVPSASEQPSLSHTPTSVETASVETATTTASDAGKEHLLHPQAPTATPVAPSHGASQQIPAAPERVSLSQAGAHYGGVSAPNKAGIIKDGSGKLLWQCSTCGATNDIDALECGVCGDSMFAEYIREADSRRKPAASPGTAAAWGAIPGGGQWVTGHRGDAIGRALLILWLIGCAIVLNDKSILWVRVIFAVAGIATWAISALDARIQAGSKGIQILTVKRMLLVLVLSVALLLALSFVLAGKVRELDKNNPRGPGPGTEVPAPGDPGNGSGADGGDGAPT